MAQWMRLRTAARLVRPRPQHFAIVQRPKPRLGSSSTPMLQASASALRPHVVRVASSVWTPLSVRFLSLLQDLVEDPNDQNKSAKSEILNLEQITARAASKIGLDDFTSDVLPALKVLAESLQMVSESGAIRNWTSSDWLLGLTVLAQHNTAQRLKTRPPRLATDKSAPSTPDADAATESTSTPPISRREIEELLRFVRISDAVYADTAEQFCVEASLPADVIVRSFDGGVLAPKFMLLCDTSAQQIVLAVRGTASLLDFCTDICLTNEPFGDGQGHRGIVHSAQWLVKNVRADLERLTTQHPDFDLVVTGHSLGAGVSALAAMELRPQFPALRCIAFATPASVTETLASSCADYVTTVVNGDDCVPRFHQHSMMRLQGEVSQFDWRSTLRTMVDEGIEQQKMIALQKRDEQLQEIHEAFERIKQAQEKQAKAALSQALETPVGRRVSASLELTKAAFWTDQPATERIANIKQVIQKQKLTGDDTQLWDMIESSVAGLESLARAIHRPQEAQALLTKSKVLLASAGIEAEFTEETSADASKEPSKVLDVDVFRARIKSVIDQTKQTLPTEVAETFKEVADTVATKVETIKDEVDAAFEQQSAKLDESVAAIQSGLARSTEAVVKQTQQTAMGVAALAPLLKEFDVAEEKEHSLHFGVDPVNQDLVDAMAGTGTEMGEEKNAETSLTDAETSSDPQPTATELLEPLFPPGRILYLNRLMGHDQTARDAVELLHVTNDEFSRVVLSNDMVLDHLCTTYERSLQAIASELFSMEIDSKGDQGGSQQ